MAAPAWPADPPGERDRFRCHAAAALLAGWSGCSQSTPCHYRRCHAITAAALTHSSDCSCWWSASICVSRERGGVANESREKNRLGPLRRRRSRRDREKQRGRGKEEGAKKRRDRARWIRVVSSSACLPPLAHPHTRASERQARTASVATARPIDCRATGPCPAVPWHASREVRWLRPCNWEVPG